MNSFFCDVIIDSMALEPAERLEDVTHLAGLCIEVLQQNEEHHSEVCNAAYHCRWYSQSECTPMGLK